jgi:hypothetical protein
MKKIIPILFLALTLVTGCSSAKKDTLATSSASSASLQKESENITFEYTALTRGAYKKVVVTSYDIITIKDRDNKDVASKKLTAEEWKTLSDAYKGIKDLNALSSIEAPSVKHQYDGALAAMLTITIGEQVYQTTTFDHGNPPAEIKPLVDDIIKLSALN